MRTTRSAPYWGGLNDRDPSWTETPLDRDPPDRETPNPWTETPRTETPPGQRHPWTETPR